MRDAGARLARSQNKQGKKQGRRRPRLEIADKVKARVCRQVPANAL